MSCYNMEILFCMFEVKKNSIKKLKHAEHRSDESLADRSAAHKDGNYRTIASPFRGEAPWRKLVS